MANRLTNTQIESAAVDAVNVFFNSSEMLSPDIPKRDKNPVWDGKLLLYKKGQRDNNKGLVGQIPVQVKGKSNKNIPQGTIKYSCKVNDLEVYKNNNGVAFFVVYVHPETMKTNIFFRLLAPIELRKLVRDAEGKQKISVEMKELFSLSEYIEYDFWDFYNDCKKQQSFSCQESLDIKEILSSIDTFNFQITANSGDRMELMRRVTTTDVFFYVTFKGDPTKTLHPVGDGRCRVDAFGEGDCPILVGNQKFYDKYEWEVSKGKSYLKIGGFFRIPVTSCENETFTVNLKFNKLSEKIKGLEFLLAIDEYKEIKFGELTNINIRPRYDVERIKNELNWSKDFRVMLEMLKVDKDPDISKISDREEKDIKTLIEHFIYGKEISPSNKLDAQISILNISDISLSFLCVRNKDTGKYDFSSINDLSKYVFLNKPDSKHSIIVPSYFAFDKEVFSRVDNIDYSAFMQETIDKRSLSDFYLMGVNIIILRMISAYDEQEIKNQQLINTALQLTNWLIEENKSDSLTEMLVLNRLQIVKRLRDFSADETEILLKYLESGTLNDEGRFAVNLLLNNKNIANNYFKKLPIKVQELYVKEMPIYYFMNN